jgi:predicted RNA-binding Zn-ribbon protein involved in translation (DUF1610 family)
MVPRSVYHGLESQDAYERREAAIADRQRASEAARIDRFMAFVDRVQEWLADSNVRTYWLRQIEAGADDTRWAGGRRLSWPADRPAVYGILAMIGQEYSRIEIVPDEVRASPWWNANRNWHWVSSDDQGQQLLTYVERDLAQHCPAADGLVDDAEATAGGKEGRQGPPSGKARLPRAAAVAAIGAHLKANPLASSTTIEEATGLDAGYVRSLWGPIKKAMKEGKRDKPRGWKRTDGQPEAVDPTATCTICDAPLRERFYCDECGEAIAGECKTCHYTNTHPELATP